MKGLLKQGMNCDYDHLREIVNRHADVQVFLAHDVWFDPCLYERWNIKDNVELLTPELMREVNRLVVSISLQAERHEAGDQFGVDPIRFGQSAPASPERLDLRRREPPRFDPFRLQARSKTPFTAAATSKQTNASLPTAISSSSEIPSAVFGRRS